MPKTLNSVTLSNDCIKFIETYCKRKDISEAAFSRKFGKNNRWVSDLRRGKNTNLPSKEIAVQMCLTLNVFPDDILIQEGKTPEETAKCLEDIETVRKLVEAERAKENAHDPKTVGEDAQLAQFIAKFNRLSPQQKSAVLAVMEGYQPSQE